MAEARRSSTASRGELSHFAKLTRDQVRTIRERYVEGAHFPHQGSARVLAEEFGISVWYVPLLAASNRWAWLDAEQAVHTHVEI
ncbi:hypothetical protein ACFZB5_19830 [Streptomyces nodosus]|uniref:hypothetical protein n=1 Tax=Streptomyces nodosus TaxID=40318 RepID=UPI0036EF52FA